MRKAAQHVALILACAVILAGAALWNGYPLVYFDSEDYVTMAFTWDVVIYRTLPYSLVIWVAKELGSLWWVVAMQALAAAIVLHEAFEAFLPRRPLHWLLFITVALVALTAWPWYIAQVMGDAWTGTAYLGLAVLAFGGTLSWWRRAAVVPLVAVAIMVHMSHVAVAGGLLLTLAALKLVSLALPALPRPRLALVALAVALGTAAIPLSHWAATGKAMFSPSGRVLQLALFVQHGLVERYLDDACPRGARLKLCPYRDDLPDTADSFLWAPWEFPFFRKLGGWRGMMDEADFIVTEIIRHYPEEVARHSIEATIEQLAQTEVGEGLNPKIRENWAGDFLDVEKARFPHELRAYLHSRQNTEPGIDFAPVNALQVPLGLATVGITVAMLLLGLKRRDRTASGLAFLVLVVMIGNALVCGALSNPHHRYQSRMLFLAMFATAVGAIRLDYRLAHHRRRGVGKRTPMAMEVGPASHPGPDAPKA
ncbi:MAG: hypothetical protein HY985_16410 [Magnetospirillum sp.]|nr:hypothetical protein [Magnetospirillum sp.]